VFHWRPP